MKIGRNRMHGWTWTSQGWQKRPRRLRPAKSVSKPTRRKTRRARRLNPAVPRPARPVGAEGQQAAETRRSADSAPVVPEPATPAPRSPRKAWSGKYDDLATPTKEEPLTYPNNPPSGLDWGADYDTPQTYARIGRALMLFLFNASNTGNTRSTSLGFARASTGSTARA